MLDSIGDYFGITYIEDEKHYYYLLLSCFAFGVGVGLTVILIVMYCCVLFVKRPRQIFYKKSNPFLPSIDKPTAYEMESMYHFIYDIPVGERFDNPPAYDGNSLPYGPGASSVPFIQSYRDPMNPGNNTYTRPDPDQTAQIGEGKY